jgi:hypothetical protein
MDRTVIDPLSCSGIDWAAFLILDISNTGLGRDHQ